MQSIRCKHSAIIKMSLAWFLAILSWNYQKSYLLPIEMMKRQRKMSTYTRAHTMLCRKLFIEILDFIFVLLISCRSWMQQNSLAVSIKCITEPDHFRHCWKNEGKKKIADNHISWSHSIDVRDLKEHSCFRKHTHSCICCSFDKQNAYCVCQCCVPCAHCTDMLHFFFTRFARTYIIYIFQMKQPRFEGPWWQFDLKCNSFNLNARLYFSSQSCPLFFWIHRLWLAFEAGDCVLYFIFVILQLVCLFVDFFFRFVFSVVLSWFVLVCLISFCHNLPLWYVLCFFVQCHFAMFARSMQYELKWTKNRFCFVSWTWMLLNLVFFFLISFSSVVCTVHISRRPFYKNSFLLQKFPTIVFLSAVSIRSLNLNIWKI